MAKKKKTRPEGTLGREPIITRELIAEIAGYVRVGNYIETAFMACGVKKPTYYQWMAKGRLKKGTLYAALVDEVTKAMAQGEVRDIMIIDRAANGAKAELMREKVREMGPDGKMVEVDRVVYDGDGKPVVLRPGTKPDWKAAAWRAERRHPEHWGRSEHLNLDVNEKPKDDGKGNEDETVGIDPYSIKATLEKIRGEY